MTNAKSPISNQCPIPNSDFVTITISNTGPGIPPDRLDKIFDRFYQTEQGKSVGGTGIGLTLSRELAQLMGGDIQVSSLNQKGAKFIFTFQANFGDALLSTQIPKPQHTYAEERNTWLPWDDLHYSVIKLKSGEKICITSILITDFNSCRGQMGRG